MRNCKIERKLTSGHYHVQPARRPPALVSQGSHKENIAPNPQPTLRKRPLSEARTQPSNTDQPRAKKIRQVSTPLKKLCFDCSRLDWEALTHWIEYSAPTRFKSKPIAYVGTRYRNISPETTCTLCRLLSAPWITSFLRRHAHECKGNHAKDTGDEIHIFRHLRYLPHVDYSSPQARKLLRDFNVPWHIAVLPQKKCQWQEDFAKHVEANGLVVCLPRPNYTPWRTKKSRLRERTEKHNDVEKKEHKKTLFDPQLIARQFDAAALLPALKYCKKEHTTLCRPPVPKVSGMRLIDCMSKDRIVRGHPGEEYLTLSYVWGDKRGDQHEEPEQSSSPLSGSSRRTTLSLPSKLPLTIQDAMRVTRSLGYRFLWVDKYCIDQQNDEEKADQFARMGDIYAGSQITLVALGDSAEYGLPGVSRTARKAQDYVDMGPYRFMSTLPDPHHLINQSAWSTRAWTYQEGLLSRRRLVFLDHQVYFECNAMNCTECLPSTLDPLHILRRTRFRVAHRAGLFICDNVNAFCHLDVRNTDENYRRLDLIRRYQQHLQNYTKRQLSYASDSLNAFEGIAKHYESTSAMIFSLSGLGVPLPLAGANLESEGRDHLAYALSWQHASASWDVRQRPKRRGDFPSFSWGGWEGQLRDRDDLPSSWTNLLRSVQLELSNGELYDFAMLHRQMHRYKVPTRRLHSPTAIHFEAYALAPDKIDIWCEEPGEEMPSFFLNPDLILNLSDGPTSVEGLEKALRSGELRCVVLGTHSGPRTEVLAGLRSSRKKKGARTRRDTSRILQGGESASFMPTKRTANQRRIDTISWDKPNVIVCLIVKTTNRISYRVGVLEIVFRGNGDKQALRGWTNGPREKFILG